jgi:membrane protease YdiL (CAAX protease family)
MSDPPELPEPPNAPPPLQQSEAPPSGTLPEAPQLPPTPAPERVPFWGYHDLFVVAGLFVVSLIGGFASVSIVLKLIHVDPKNDLFRLLPGQFIAYLFLFLSMRLMFRAQYQRPFWSSMGWTELRMRPSLIIAYGVLLAFAVGLAGRLLHTPEAPTPMSKLLSDRTSIMVVAVFGSTVGPMCEELIFRGFLQPLLMRSLGAAAGILAAAVPFGLLHLPEYNGAWQYGVLITLAGAAFGWIRWRTGSTKASTLMHAAYNGMFFLALLLQPKNLTQ